MEPIIPPYLKKGDKIAIVSTARKISEKEVLAAVELLQNWGFEPIFGKHLFCEYNQFAGNDKERAVDLQQALNDEDIKAIWCARGGYGTIRLLDLMDFSTFVKQPKWVVGYSDVTVLHNYINQVLNVATIHATMPINVATNSGKSLQTLYNALTGKDYAVELPLGKKNRCSVNVDETGELVGGNLSILYSLTGTKVQINTVGKFLFIEDLDEYLYHIDRMMMNLKYAGMLHGIKALLVGGMTDMHDNTVPFGKTAEEIILDAVKEYDFAVYFNVPAGHLNDNRALVFKKRVRIWQNKLWF